MAIDKQKVKAYFQTAALEVYIAVRPMMIAAAATVAAHWFSKASKWLSKQSPAPASDPAPDAPAIAAAESKPKE